MEEEADSREAPVAIVGIGASAGGLEAIERLFDHMPTDTGMAFVVIQHLSPDYKSLMKEVLARWTSMPIFRVEDGMEVRRNVIYLIPPKKEMIISDGRLLLNDKDAGATLSLPIDRFFRSLGQDCGPRAIAAVLSGTGSDGSRGIADVHEGGGLVVVQAPSSAKFDGMPRMAEDTGLADLVITPEEMPDTFGRFARDPRIARNPKSLDNSSLDETGLKHIFTLIRDTYGLDFSNYKLSTVVRRTERRLVLSGNENVAEYLERLRRDSEELSQLYRDLLIGVTRFFRDPEAYEELRSSIITDLVNNAPEGTELRVWIAGCATGEEAYSVAILFDEVIRDSGRHLGTKIFATDVHPGSLAIAGQGFYSEAALSDVTPERISRFFTQVSGGFQVAAKLRQKIVFAQHNLVKDAPFTKMDLISCRNLLIYLQPSAQQRVLSLFHFGLKTGAALMLGPSESAGEISDEFDQVSSQWNIFRKHREARLPSDIRLTLSRGLGTESRPLTPPSVSVLNQSTAAELLTVSTYDALLDTVMPPSLLVSEQGKLLHTFGDAGKHLKPERGRHSGDVRDRLSDGLKMSVSTAIGKALKDNRKVSYSGVRLAAEGEDGAARKYDITATPILDPRSHTRSALVQIREADITHGVNPEPEDVYTSSGSHVTMLESELMYTKESLQSAIEELETSNEELQATNEELVASNEELQSTNEELHSVNEELYTVNAEHQSKILQLSEVTRDVDNLLESTEVDTVFLDSEMRIRKFTPRVAERFSFLPQDIGRRFDSFTHSIECEGIAEKIQSVMRTDRPHEEEVWDQQGSCLLMRILPYHTVSAKTQGQATDGALVTLVDITTLKNITKLKEASDALAESLRQRDRFLAMLSHELRNPLAAILNATHLLTSPKGSEVAEEPIAIIKRQSRQMATLLDDLLDVTRVSQGKIQIQKRPFDLRQAMANAVESVQGRCEAREQEIVQRLPEGPVWVRGSEPRILQVLVNLLTNASKYSAKGTPIELKVGLQDDEVAVRVADRGVGISAEQIDRVFELFVQSDRTLDRADGGLGVGLTLVKSLVELHGGRVEVHSDGEGKGSEFTVFLPICRAPDQVADAVRGPTTKKAVRRVVLVEDNIDAGKMLAFLLEDAGFEVSIAHDGVKGLETIRSTKPDAAIIDVGLPEMNGYEVAKAIRQDEGLIDVLLVALTGYGQANDRVEALESGFNEHLVKPVDPELLSRMLAESSTSSAT